MGEKETKPFQLTLQWTSQSRFPRIACHFRRWLDPGSGVRVGLTSSHDSPILSLEAWAGPGGKTREQPPCAGCFLGPFAIQVSSVRRDLRPRQRIRRQRRRL